MLTDKDKHEFCNSIISVQSMNTPEMHNAIKILMERGRNTMGTRGAVGFRIDEVDKIWYNHSDSYPDGLGQDVVDWVKNTDLEKGRELVKELIALGDDIDPETLKDVQLNAEKSRTIDLGVSTQSMDDVYCLLRHAQRDIDKTLEVGYLQDSSDFLIDSLFCEYAYIINFDTNKLEFYQGFNKDNSADGRYAFKYKENSQEYCGVALVGEFPLNNIPHWWEQIYVNEDYADVSSYVESRHKSVKAIQWNTQNEDLVIEFCPGIEFDGFIARINKGFIKIEPGNFIVLENGSYSVYPEDKFHEKYEWNDK